MDNALGRLVALGRDAARHALGRIIIRPLEVLLPGVVLRALDIVLHGFAALPQRIRLAVACGPLWRAARS